MRSLAPFPGVHNVALHFLSGKTQQVDSLYEFTSPGHLQPFLLLPGCGSSLRLSLPAEEEARGYAENKIRYSNMSTRSPTSSCVFRGQPSPIFSACESEILCVRTGNRYLSPYHHLYVFFEQWREMPGHTAPSFFFFFSHGCPQAAVLSNSQQSMDSAVSHKQTGRRKHRRPRCETGGDLRGTALSGSGGELLSLSSVACVFTHVCVRPFCILKILCRSMYVQVGHGYFSA